MESLDKSNKGLQSQVDSLLQKVSVLEHFKLDSASRLEKYARWVLLLLCVCVCVFVCVCVCVYMRAPVCDCRWL